VIAAAVVEGVLCSEWVRVLHNQTLRVPGIGCGSTYPESNERNLATLGGTCSGGWSLLQDRWPRLMTIGDNPDG